MEENINNKIEQPTIIKTDVDAKDGQNKCPRCGATDIELNMNNSKLRCNFCRHEFESEKLEGLESDISKLEGFIVGSGAQNIMTDTNDIVTFKCSSCGSEVVIDTNEALQARCHWCRNTLSMNQQIPNGAVPDVVLPFAVKKADAQAEIEKFVGKRKFFANPKFREEFTTQNIMGVYLPYMLVDLNSHSTLVGQGEVLVRQYTVGSGKDSQTYYDADLYNVVREFDLTVEGLTVESSSDKLDTAASDKTTNVINAIMPFDVENSVKWNANYLRGYSSEKRDTNVEQLSDRVHIQAKDVARHTANSTLQKYNRGVAWAEEHLDIKGQQWKAAYLPIWLYSYQELKKDDKKVLHYVAVNARTKNTMGSVPIHVPKLLLVSGILEVIGIILGIIFLNQEKDIGYLFFLLGFVYYAIIYAKYRNKGARFMHESQSKTNMNIVRETDELVGRKRAMTNAMMQGANNKRVEGASTKGLFGQISVDHPFKPKK